MGIHYGKADFINYGKPSLLLDFARNKSLVDRISGNNLITFERASIGTYVGADGLIKTAAADEPRFDHNPETGESLGLLIEEQRTNYHKNNSNNLFTMAYSNWTSDSSIVYPNGGTVGGYNTFDQISGARFFLDYNPGPGNTTYTCSVYARLKTGSSATSCSVIVKDWESDTVRGSSGSITLTNSWQRISATGTTAGVIAGLRFEVSTNTNGASSQIYLWGAQVERGSFPTSYIPTSGSQFTREPDNAYITGTNFTDFYNQTEGSFNAHFKGGQRYNLDNTTDQWSRVIGYKSGTYYTFLASHTAGTNRYHTWNGSNQVNQINGPEHISEFAKASVGYGSNTLSLATKIAVSAGSFITPTNADAIFIGNDGSSQYPLNGHIKQLTYYPTRLTNTQLQELTQ